MSVNVSCIFCVLVNELSINNIAQCCAEISILFSCKLPVEDFESQNEEFLFSNSILID